jgi:tRNA-uridine 2-sulfurtransferase
MGDPIRCVGLMSGGLDSILATRCMVELGLDVYCINFRSPFCTCTAKGASCSAAEAAVRQIGNVPLEVQVVGDDYLDVIKAPKRGRGRGMNPCLDCRAFKFQEAWRYAQSIGARFLFTGEVLGQRPMSQHKRAMDMIDKDSDLVGLVLRPLSAQLLPETIPEKEGWVDREKLLAFSGRTRRPQIALAAEFGIDEYPCAAGGCLLTDKGFAARLRDLLEAHPDCCANDMHPLKVGRHFRTDGGAKIIVGRNHGENRRLLALDPPGTRIIIDGPAPVVIVQDANGDDAVTLGLDAAFCHANLPDGGALKLAVRDPDGTERDVVRAPSSTRAELRARMDGWRL